MIARYKTSPPPRLAFLGAQAPATNAQTRLLARFAQECLNDRRQAVYANCTQTAKEMASLTSSGMNVQLLAPLKQGLLGAVLRVLAPLRTFFLPWTRFIPFIGR